MFKSEFPIQICASATKTAIFAAKSQLSIKDPLSPPALRPMLWCRRVTGMDQVHHGSFFLWMWEVEASLEREMEDTPRRSRSPQQRWGFL